MYGPLMDGGWTESGKPRPFPNPAPRGGDRYRTDPATGSKVRLCLECGCVVWSVDIHDHFHAA